MVNDVTYAKKRQPALNDMRIQLWCCIGCAARCGECVSMFFGNDETKKVKGELKKIAQESDISL